MAAQNLLDDPVPSTLWHLSLPMAVGIVFMFLVSLIDTYWASKLGTDALAAMSFSFPVIGIIINVTLGLMIGTSVAIARVVGTGDKDAARRLASHAMLLGVAVVAIVTGVGLLTQDMLFTALGAPPSLLPTIDAYMRIWYIAAVFLVVPMILNGVLRAYGDAKTARNVMILAAVFNAILDPLFIFGWGPVPAFGLEGAAIATAISRALTLVYAGVIALRMQVLDLHLPSPRELIDSWRKVLQVGLPATVTNVLGPVATSLLTAIVATHGSAAVAAYGIGARVEAILLIPPLALSSGLSPFIGQNWGAHLPARVAEAFRVSVRFSLVWGLLSAVVMVACAPYVAQVFSNDITVQEDIALYLRIVPLGYGAYSVMVMVASSFNAVDHATRSTILSVLRSLALAVPLAWLGSYTIGLPGIFVGLTAASILTAAIGFGWMRMFLLEEVPVRADAPASTNDAPFLLSKTQEDQRVAMQALIDTVLALEHVELHRTRRDAVGFFVGSRELGHIHPAGHLDLPLPVDIGEKLQEHEMVEPHHMHDNHGWYTRKLHDANDIKQATWLLKLAHALYELSTRGADDPITQAELDSLNLPEGAREGIIRCTARWAA